MLKRIQGASAAADQLPVRLTQCHRSTSELDCEAIRLSNPLLLEDVLVWHPKGWAYICHAEWPFLNELLRLLYAIRTFLLTSQIINWALPEAEFHAYLRRNVYADF